MLGAIGIHVERAAVPDDPFGLDLQALRFAITMAVDCNGGAHRNGAFLKARLLGPSRRSQRDVPHFAVGCEHFHGGVRSGQAHRGLNGTRELEFLIEISRPAVMSRSWKSRKRKRENTSGDAERESRIHSSLSLIHISISTSI